jgi:ectoine hydroxylase-related dioxygenase (phytanoyl-CoA dioxygenase family)
MTALSDAPARSRVWLSPDDCRVENLQALVVPTELQDYPHAADVVDNVLVYDCARLRSGMATAEGRREVQAELARALMDGPGLTVFKGAFPDVSVVDRATEAFFAMIEEQHASGAVAGDHFAKPGANDRVWNALEKLAVREPEVFVRYYANDVLALAATAWLGPSYQMTSTINVVNPGGAAQTGHRDYHLGFQTDDVAAQYPSHVHRLSPVLTLQGAVAHSDMPVETGPTTYLPCSQRYEPGYLAWRRPDFLAHYEANKVQLPLEKGDAAFFNPALLHAAGENRSTDRRRMANLLQVSSAFGRAMESVDRQKMSNALLPTLAQLRGTLSDEELRHAIACAAEGYAFPTNLDRDQPVGGLVPETQAQMLWRAVREQWDAEQLRTELGAHAIRRLTDEVQ